MSNFNKIISNVPVELTKDEVEALSKTLSAVQTAGSGEGRTYLGDGAWTRITGDNNNVITLTTDAINKINRSIPEKVTDLSDASAYATVSGLDDDKSYAMTTSGWQEFTIHEESYTSTNVSNDGGLSGNGLANNKLGIDGTLLTKWNAASDDATNALASAAYLTGFSANGKWLIAGDISGKQDKADMSAYVTSSTDAITGTKKYGLTTGGWQPIDEGSGGGGTGGLTEVYHDLTLTGDGTSEAVLGVNHETVMNSALSAGKAWNLMNAAGTEVSSFAEITAAIAGKLASISIDADGGLSGDGINTAIGISANYVKGGTFEADKTYAKTSNGWAAFTAGITEVIHSDNGISGDGTSNSPLGISAEFLQDDKTNWEPGSKYARTTTGWAQIMEGIGSVAVAVNGGISGTGVIGSPLGISATYIGSAGSATKAHALMNDDGSVVSSFTNITGAIDWGNTLAGQLAGYSAHWQEVSACSAVTANSAHWNEVSSCSAVTANSAHWNDAYKALTRATYSSNWDHATSAVTSYSGRWDGKSYVTVNTANNAVTVSGNPSASISAISYVNNTLNNRAFLPQKACVCLEDEIYDMSMLANGQGMLFFVVSAH